MKAIGIDLAGKEANPTGFCVLEEDGNTQATSIFYYDRDIIAEIRKENPDVVAIDAPFTFPGEGPFREGDSLLAERGFRPLSPNFPHMQELVRRVRSLMHSLPGVRMIEVFSQASSKALGKSWDGKGSKDAFDAWLAALTGMRYLQGRYEELGRKEKIVVPKPV